MDRTQTLDAASKAVADRGLNYGSPESNFERIAARWNTHLANVGMVPDLTGIDVAMMLVDVKMARLENDPTHQDSWVDIAGYAACGSEVAGAGITDDDFHSSIGATPGIDASTLDRDYFHGTEIHGDPDPQSIYEPGEPRFFVGETVNLAEVQYDKNPGIVDALYNDGTIGVQWPVGLGRSTYQKQWLRHGP